MLTKNSNRCQVNGRAIVYFNEHWKINYRDDAWPSRMQRVLKLKGSTRNYIWELRCYEMVINALRPLSWSLHS